MLDWNLRGYILTSKHRKNVLRSLKEKPKTVMQLSEELGVDKGFMYKIVKELLAVNVINHHVFLCKHVHNYQIHATNLPTTLQSY